MRISVTGYLPSVASLPPSTRPTKQLLSSTPHQRTNPKLLSFERKKTRGAKSLLRQSVGCLHIEAKHNPVVQNARLYLKARPASLKLPASTQQLKKRRALSVSGAIWMSARWQGKIKYSFFWLGTTSLTWTGTLVKRKKIAEQISLGLHETLKFSQWFYKNVYGWQLVARDQHDNLRV